ncbi:MAG: hypothetical protein U0936_26880 [Planctomycetaceae bacterium]
MQNFIGKKAGYEILAEGGRQYGLPHVEKADGFAAFPDTLPYRISREASRTGSSTTAGRARKERKGIWAIKILGPQRAWDRFVGSIHVHIEYWMSNLRSARSH